MKIVVSIGSGISFFFLLVTTLLIGVSLFCPIYKVQYETMKYGVDLKDSNYNAKLTLYYFEYYVEYEINPLLGSSIYSQTIDLDFSSNLAPELIKRNENKKQPIFNKSEENYDQSHNRTKISNYYNTKMNYFQSNSPLYQFLNIFNYIGKIILFLKMVPIILVITKMSLQLYGNTLSQRNIRALLNFSVILVQGGILILLILMVFLLFHVPKVFRLQDRFESNLISLNNNNNSNDSNSDKYVYNQTDLYGFKGTTLYLDTCQTKPFDYYIYYGRCKTFTGKAHSLDGLSNELDYRWGPSISWFLTLTSTILEFIVFVILLKTFVIESMYQINGTTINRVNRNPNGNVEMSSIPSKMVFLNIEIKSEISNEN
ncbi:hypothetical protein RB653_000927 [Dictyostelium firmibasis]|uniref:Transmembrane protein n=1 Tax=Dictyostelium firmibasis TaxID=79012 RepID=A0AAN7U6L7_9MYCE